MLTRTLFQYEWRQLVRDRWITVVMILFLTLTAFAVFNGTEKVRERKASIAKARGDLAQAEAIHKADIDSIRAGLKEVKEAWRDPRLLNVVGSRMARVAAMDPQPLAFISTGQSDLFAHYTRPVLYGEATALGFSELANPVQLLFGSFDLAFVCIYLLPLLVLAFSYNILSAEREAGTLRLTLAQPVSLFSWLLAKLTVRFLLLAGIVIGSVVVCFLFFGFPISRYGLPFAQLIGFVLAYMAFWLLIALSINLLGRSSGTNAVALISIWVVFVLLIPAVISQFASTLYPVPSRINLVHQYRVAQAEAGKKVNDILKDYYRDHPELAPEDPEAPNAYQFWLKYFASLAIIKSSVQPVLDNYDQALRQQQQWVSRWRFLSPAILLQNTFNQIAGTAPEDYVAFREQVITFAETWRNYFMPRMFANERMASKDFDQLPVFQYRLNTEARTYTSDGIALVLFCALAFAWSALRYQRSAVDSLLMAG